MLKLLGLIFKFTLFASLVLVLGNYLRWNGKTISDQVRTQMANAERSRSVQKAKNWTEDLVDEAKSGAEDLYDSAKKSAARKLSIGVTSARADKARHAEEIPPTERQKLRALIQELNGARDL